VQRVLPALALDDEAVVETPGVGLASASHRLEADGTDLLLKEGEVTVARIAFRETLRPEARAEVARLQAAGVRVHIASGDARDKVLAVAAALGVAPDDAHAELSPEGKAALVLRLGREHTLVLGDGINDARAFEVALVAGTPAIDRPTLPARADFVLLGHGVGPLAELVGIARKTRAVSHTNLVIASLYNVLGLTAGLLGWLSPLVAAVAMPLSSLLVIGLTLAAYRRADAPRLRATVTPEVVCTPSL
jgi:Cu2+-exporting ATPase